MRKITLILFSFVLIGMFTIFGICKPLSDSNVNAFETTVKHKYVKSTFINHVDDVSKEIKEEEKFEEEVKDREVVELRKTEEEKVVYKKQEEKQVEKKEETKKEEVKTETKPSVTPSVTPTPTPTPTPSPSPTPTVTTKSGRVTYYILNCSGCSGNLASGKKTNNSMYNGYRAIAAGYEYKFGTLIRISGTPLGTFTGIVLDRGGAIGETKKFTFDILVDDYNTAIRYGTSNITYQVIREGW